MKTLPSSSVDIRSKDSPGSALLSSLSAIVAFSPSSSSSSSSLLFLSSSSLSPSSEDAAAAPTNANVFFVVSCSAFSSSFFCSSLVPKPKLSASTPSSSKISVNNCVAYVETKIETPKSAQVSNITAFFACSLTAPVTPSISGCKIVRKMMFPKYASINAVLELPIKCAAKNSQYFNFVTPHTYQFPLIGMGRIGHNLNNNADLNPSGITWSGKLFESNRLSNAWYHFLSFVGSPSLANHLKFSAFSLNTVLPSQKFALAAIVDANDVNNVPFNTFPNTIGDNTGSTKPIGRNSSVIVTFSAKKSKT
mmetsp:Transcript_3097/g.9554  ORF Transcript_3097/g.9554 Transcript_3097/m.9554 type:complete len:307 (+) Transcript_3097:211-1131(+)